MATLTTQQIALTGLNLSPASASASGDKFRPGDTTFLVLANTNASSRTVTIDRVRPSNTGQDDDVAIVLAQDERKKVGPFPAVWFAGSDGLASITYSAHADVTVSCVAL